MVTSVTHFPPATPITHIQSATHVTLTRLRQSNSPSRYIHLATSVTHIQPATRVTLTSLRPSNSPRRFTHFGHVRYTPQATLVQNTLTHLATSVTLTRLRWSNSLCSYTLTHLATSVTLAQPGTHVTLIGLRPSNSSGRCTHSAKLVTLTFYTHLAAPPRRLGHTRDTHLAKPVTLIRLRQLHSPGYTDLATPVTPSRPNQLHSIRLRQLHSPCYTDLATPVTLTWLNQLHSFGYACYTHPATQT